MTQEGRELHRKLTGEMPSTDGAEGNPNSSPATGYVRAYQATYQTTASQSHGASASSVPLAHSGEGADEGGGPGLIRIEATSYRDALKQISDRFGKEASIVSTRRIRLRGLKGVLGSTGVEVYVARKEDHGNYLRHRAEQLLSVRAPAHLLPEAGTPDVSLRAAANPASANPAGAPSAATGAPPPVGVSPPRGVASPTEQESIARAIDDLRAQVQDLIRDDGRATSVTPVAETAPIKSPVVREAARILEGGGFSSAMTADLLDRLARRRLPEIQADRSELRTLARLHLGELIRAKIPPCVPISPSSEGEPTVVALVGPTGVGKTTTIAKLASHFHLAERCKVGLVTTDTYRIGAVEQLRRFSEILGLPLSVVEEGGRVRDAIDSLRDHDLVFVDTAGRSQRDADRLDEVRERLSGIGSLEVHLCISLAAARDTILEVANKFRTVPYNRLLITKRDESARHGALLDLFYASRTPVSYVTCGQEVPNDFNAASVERLETLLLGES